MITTSTDRLRDDLEWALGDRDVQELYAGEIVAVLERKIVAHGTDEETVLREAAQVTGRARHELALCVVQDLLQDIPH
jgi:hypothetical protein